MTAMRKAIQKQFDFVLELLKEPRYRYLLDSGAIRVLFEHQGFKILRTVTGPNNSPIFQIIYDAIDHLEGLHSKLAGQRAVQASSLKRIDTSPAPKIGLSIAGLPWGTYSIESPPAEQNSINADDEVKPLDSLTVYVKHLKEQARGKILTKKFVGELDL